LVELGQTSKHRKRRKDQKERCDQRTAKIFSECSLNLLRPKILLTFTIFIIAALQINQAYPGNLTYSKEFTYPENPIFLTLTSDDIVQNITQELITGAGEGSFLGNLLQSWHLISVILLVIILTIITVAYMISKSFNIPNLKAWADTELCQLIATAVIIILVFILILVLNGISESIATSLFPDLALDEEQPKHIQIAEIYLEKTIESIETSARGLLRQNINLGIIATKREGYSLQTLPYIAYSENKNAYKRLDMTRNNSLFNHYARILLSLKVQEIFIKTVGLYLGPFFLLIGIILRSLFVTRKAGGLCISIGFGLIFAPPCNYFST